MNAAATPSDSLVLAGPVVLYDGLCGFCDVAVRWLLEHDRDGIYRYAPLQGETAQALLARHPEVPPGLDSILLVEPIGDGERVWWHSSAIFRMGSRLPMPWRTIAWLGVLPRFVTDLGYRIFTRLRYRVWGRRESCRIPTPEQRARFMP